MGTFYSAVAPLSNFLYTPGVGVTNLERTGPASLENYEGSVVSAINASGQILLASGVVYSADRPRQDLGPAVRAAYPGETVHFISLNDSGTVSGTSDNGGAPGGYSQHVFRYTPGSPAGVVTVASTNTPRTFPRGPFVMDDAANVVYSVGFPPGGADVFTGAGATMKTGCGHGNGWATVINNSGQIGGGWGKNTAFPEICTFDPTTFASLTTALVDETVLTNNGFVTGLNNEGDAVGYSAGIPLLFTAGRAVNINSLFSPDSGWARVTAAVINDAGEIAGTGLNGVPAVFILTPVPSATYSVQPLCEACTGITLSNSGFTVSRGTSSSTFLVSSPRGPEVQRIEAGSIRRINNVGTVAGADLSGHAFIANPPYDQFYNLNTIFGWSQGIATGINDGNDVIGVGDPASFGPRFANLNVTNLYQINNAGQITGSYTDADTRTHFFLYTPGLGVADLPGEPIALSNRGYVLLFSERVGYSVRKAAGLTPLPDGVTWRGLNDRDEVVGDCGDPTRSDCASYYSLERGLIHLTASGFKLTSAVAINDAGRILANGSALGSSVPVAVLLSPESERTSLPRDQSQAPNQLGVQGTELPPGEPTHLAPVKSLNGNPAPGQDNPELR
ncbi:MAG: hypothetical protein JWN34_1941 [Bryobacterales bacterium]|nr:hypothetical protein [Bryobacterales bacterium]